MARGQQLFDDQQYEESLQVLSAALVRPGNTATQRIEIYRLLAYNYITLGRHDEAESACRGIFSLDPCYKLSDRESPRFRDFFLVAKKRWESDGRPGLIKPTEAPAAPVTMRHASPPSADKGTEIPLSARLDDPQRRITEVKLFYRSGSKGRFTSLTAQLNVPDGSVRATIPHTAVMPPLVEYYLQGTDAIGPRRGLARRRRGAAAGRHPRLEQRVGPPGRHHRQRPRRRRGRRDPRARRRLQEQRQPLRRHPAVHRHRLRRRRPSLRILLT